MFLSMSGARPLFYILISISFSFNIICIFDRSFFYRVSGFWGEPRFERQILTTFDTQIAGGSTSHGRNNFGNKSGILSIYGPEKLGCFLAHANEHQEFDRIIESKKNEFSSITIKNNKKLNDDSNYRKKKFIFTGVFDIFEANFNYYQNLISGSFWHFHLPVVSIEIFPRICTISSENILKINKLLEINNLSLKAVNERGFSDSTLFLGWAKNYEDTIYLDFIDFTFKAGVLFPTGKQRNENLVFSIPLGYNGHWGIPWSIDLATGGYEWITVGLHSDGVLFFDRTTCMRLRTQEKCTGLIRFKKDIAKIEAGTVWRIGGFLKADHICWGLSFLLGFSFEQQNRSVIKVFDKDIFNFNTINNDFRFKKWFRSICFVNIEYDFAKEENRYNGHFGLTYNHQISGKRTFNTDMLGGYYGIDIVWCF